MDIVGTMRAQMLGQLIDALGTGAAKIAAAAQLALTQGQTLSAAVLGEIADGKLALRLQGQTIVADIKGSQLPPDARQPGAQLHLRVDAAGQEPRLSFVGFSVGGGNAAALASGTLAKDLAVAKPDMRITPAPIAAPATTPLQAAVADAGAKAAARQGSAAPLYANLATLAASLPQALQTLTAQVVANRLSGDAPVTPQALREAMNSSGVLADAQAARGTPQLDTKTLLVALKALLPEGAAPETRAVPPEPPHRDGGPSAQKPLPPLLPPPLPAALAAETDAKLIAGTLRQDVEQALERTKLHQIASLPDPRPQAGDAPRAQQLSFELPIALGQQTAIMGLRIERDPEKRKTPRGPIDVWGVRFAIETDEIGAVHAHVRLAGDAVSVSLWADDPLTQRAFAAAVPGLEAAFRDHALEVGEIAVFAGRPHPPRSASPGRFMDARA